MKLPKLSSPLKLFQSAPAQPALGAAGVGGTMMFASRGGGGGNYDPGDDYDDFDAFDDYDDVPPEEPVRRPRATRSSRPEGDDDLRGVAGGRPRTSQFQPEDRYWTDYLRIALPVVGLLLMIGLLWFWADRLINDDADTTDPEVPTEDIGLVNTATPTPPPANVESTPPPANTGTETTPPPDNTGEEEPTAPPEDANGQETAEETPPPPDEGTDAGGTFSSGQTVVVTDPLNMRQDPTTDGEIISELAAGDSLTILSGPQEGEDWVWWEVQTADGSTAGWVVEDYIEASE